MNPSKSRSKIRSRQESKLHSERQFVEGLRRQALRRASRNLGSFILDEGIGDDCSVISSPRRAANAPRDNSNDLLVTTDLFLEGIHFRREWQPADSVGYKVLLRGISDIAAMGGIPRFAFLSLGLPRGIEARWVDEFFRGFFRLAGKTGVVLAGGDTGSSRSGVVADIMVIGEVSRGAAVLRSGARPGDSIWVSGKLGGAAHALALLRKHQSRDGRSRLAVDRKGAGYGGPNAPKGRLLQPLFYPKPRLELGQQLRARGLASAMMDLSDGLSIDLARLCKSSGVGARIDEAAIPRQASATLPMALHGGEDFELLFTVPRDRSGDVLKRLGGAPLTRIGEITKGKALRLVGGKPQGKKEHPLAVRGFEHF